MRKITMLLLAALAALALSATAVFAAVTFDPATGQGFVGKGDVQLAFNWNNKQLQQNASKVTFAYEETGTYTFECQKVNKDTGLPEGDVKTFKNKVQSLEASLNGDPRQTKGQNQFTGFILSGPDGEPVVTGEGCPGGFPHEVSKTPNEGAGTVVGLFAQFDINNDGDYDDAGERVLIWTPPAPEPTV